MIARGEIYKFRLGRDASSAYVGELVDDWGWVIAIKAQVVERDGIERFKGTSMLTDASADIVEEGTING